MSDALMSTADFTEDEVLMFKLAGRLDATEKFVLPEPPKPEEVAARRAEANVLDPKVIPAAPAGVAERIEAARKASSSFVDTGPLGGKSADGGAAAVNATEQVSADTNPDWAGKPRETPIDFADKERYLAHILGSGPFTKAYHIFGDLMTVTFRTRSPSEESQLSRQVWLDVNHETSSANGDKHLSAEERIQRYQQYQFVAALASIGRKGDVPQQFAPFAEKGNEPAGIMPIKVAHKNLRESIHSYPVFAALMNIHTEFEILVAKLTLAANEPGFWKADAAT